MPLTIHEFARAIGVSTATIWRALRNRPGISPETRAMVIEKMKEMGYQPNRLATALVTGRSQMAALWCPCLHEPYQALVIHQIQLQALRRGYDVLLRDTDAHPDGESLVEQTLRWPLDGLVLLDNPGLMESIHAHPHLASLPVISIGAYYDKRFDHVGVDLRAGAALAVRHLLDSGRRRVAYLVPSYFRDPGDARLEGYLLAMREAGCEPDILVAEGSSRPTAMETVRKRLGAGPSFDAVFCFSDLNAIGAFRALRQMGVRVPEDIAIVGCDGLEEAEFMETPLSTLSQPIPEMCEKAWDFLQQRIAEPDYPRQGILLTPKLLIRASSSSTEELA